MSNTNVKTKNLVVSAMFAAVIAVCSQIAFVTPTGVPFTLQTFAVCLCGYSIGKKRSFFALAAYILLGTVGLPIFSSFSGGLGVLVGKTGGFIFGFIPLAFLCAFSAGLKNIVFKILLGILGIAVCHAMGVLQFAFVANTGIGASFVLVSFPYLIKDAASVVISCLAAERIRPAINLDD